MRRRRPKRCEPCERVWGGALDAGLGEAVVLALPVAGGLALLGWQWPVGVLVGLASVVAGRLVRRGLVRVVRREGGGGLAAGLGGTLRHLLVSLLALGGIGLGLPPWAVIAGLLLPTAGRWAWTVRLARTPG